ncbi:hypothetical protein EDB85DRAFT_1896510 [Lactarius pseudohatsudake]|nr:hypothetical protein EDB85DRAFT_1896510 [Lactarius pseudohatsudake]
MRPPDPGATAGPLMGGSGVGDYYTPPPAQKTTDPLTLSEVQCITHESSGSAIESPTPQLPDPPTQSSVAYTQNAMDTDVAGSTGRMPPPEGETKEILVCQPHTAPPVQVGLPDSLVALALENAIDQEIGSSASDNIQALRGELGAKFVGWAAYYQEKDVKLRRDRAVAVSQDAFNKALAVVTLALDCGPVKSTDAGATMLLPHQWFRVALITVAAAVQGALPSDDIEHAAGFELDPGADHLDVHHQLKRPHTEGEALQAMLEHLAGLLRGWRGLPRDANPETFLDYLKTKSRAGLEALAVMEAKVEVGVHKAEHLQHLKDLAEPELRAEAEDWANGLRALFEAHYFDRFFSRVKQDLASASWADWVRTEEVKELRTNCLGRRDEITRKAVEQVREEARRLHYDQATAAGQEEALRAAEAQVETWKQEHFNRLKNLALKGIEDQAKLSYAPNIARWQDNGKGRSEGPKTQTSLKPRGDKRTASGQPVGSARGRSLSHTPTQTPRAKPAPLPEARRVPSAAPSMAADPDEIIEILSQVASPELGAQRIADSVHAPRTLVEAYASPEPDSAPPHALGGAVVHPDAFSDGVAWGTGPPACTAAEVMAVDVAETALTAAVSEAPPRPADPFSEVESMADVLGLDQRDRALLKLVNRLLSKVTDRLDKVEAHRSPPPREKERAPEPVANRTKHPPPPAQVAAQPQPAPPAPPSWAKVAASRVGLIIPAKAMAKHAAAVAQAAQAQKWTTVGRAKGGAPTQALTTEVVVIRKGGFADARREEVLRARDPRTIIMEVRTEVERQCRSPIKVLSGRWSTTYQRTGNFVYTLTGEVSLPAILSYKEWLCGPFPGADIAPTAGWTWSQLRGVPTADEDGHIHDKAALLKEVCSNAMFEEAVYTAAPSWQIPPEKTMAERATVLVAYVDPTGEISKHALADGIFMFGVPVKFIVSGDKPALIQCGRCHLLGHNKNSLLCKVPHTAAHTTPHDTGTSAKASTGWRGHHARSRACPKRGDFAPPKLAHTQDTPTDRQPAPAPRVQAKGKQREAPPHQRVDDEAPLDFSMSDNPLYSPLAVKAPLQAAPEPPQAPQDPPQAGPSGRITSIVPARQIQPNQPAGGYRTKLIAESEAEDQRLTEPGSGITQAAATVGAPPNPPNA